MAKALLGKAVLPDDLPFVTGSIGLLGTKPSWDMMMDCDTFLMIGSGFPYSEFLPKEGQARGVQIDIEPADAGAALPDGGKPAGGCRADPAGAGAAAAEERRTGSGANTIEKECARMVGDHGGAGHDAGRTRSTRSACSGNSRRGCRTTASSPAIPARPPTGMPATSRCGRA